MPRFQIKVIPFNKRVPYKATELLYIRAILQTKKTIIIGSEISTHAPTSMKSV